MPLATPMPVNETSMTQYDSSPHCSSAHFAARITLVLSS